MTTTWSKVTGPGTVTFADATATATSASFSAAGTYVLQLTANDGELTTNDSVTIVVNSTVVNSSLDLGGTNAYVNLGSASGLGASAFTLELWFRRDGAGIATSTGSGGLSAIPLVTKGMAEGDGSTIDMNYFLGIRSTDGVLGADFEDRATGANHPVVGTTAIPADGSWHHAAATYDGSTWRLYLDGALQIAQSVGAFTPRYDSAQWAAIGSASNSTGGVGTQTRGFFDGAVDEVRIWNYARTPQQILESLNQEIQSAQGLLGRWGFSEGTGTTISDTSGNGLHGTVIGTNYLWVSGAPFRLNQAPGQPVLQAPLNGATGVATSPTLNVAVTDPDGDPMAVTFFGRPVPAGAAPEFTIVALPDTQHYVDDPTRAATFTSQTQWVVDNQVAKNIAFVTHLGDIVEHIDAQPIEWTRANSSLSLLEAAGLKWGLAPGNHDINSAGVGTNFDLTFPVSRFTGYPWYGGYLGADPVNDPIDRQNKNNYELFSVGGLDFIIIHLEYDMPDYSVAWANRILAQYPNRRAIVTTHLFLNASGSRPATVLNRTNGTPAETVWQQLIRNNCNVFMVLNGHYPGEANRTDLNNCGRPVHQLASDYQSRTNGGDGWLRYMTFKPAENKISVYTFSPTLNGGAGLFETDANSQFVLDYNMEGTAFSPIATNSGIGSGSNTTATWAGLPAGTTFQWYVTANDGAATTTSPTWTFTTSQPNGAPVATNPGAQSSAEGASPTLQIAASDPDGNTLTYSATGLPTGLAINSTTGVISGTVAFGAAVSNSVVVTVSDGTATDTASFTWTVTRSNRAPVVTNPGAQSSAEGASPSLQIAASDPDGNTLTYSATGLPTGLAINSTTGVISGTVAFGAAVSNSVVVTVSDGTATDTASFTWTVTRSNRAPVVTNPGAQSSAEGASPSLQIAASDPDGNTLTYSATGLPTGLAINSTTGVISGTVAFGAAVSNSVVVTVSDGTATDTASFTWTVTRTNRAPVVTNPGAQSSAEGASPSLQIAASDPDGNTLTYSATGLPTGLAINSTTGVISGTVAFGAAVSNSVVVTVSDGTATDTASFTWTVTRTNRAPVVTNPGDHRLVQKAASRDDC